MIILELRATNVKGIKAIRIKPDGSMVKITGVNGSGKSSSLDCVEMGLSGKTAIPSRPIRVGEDHAETILVLGKKDAAGNDVPELVVKRHWTADDRTYLSVETPEGLSGARQVDGRQAFRSRRVRPEVGQGSGAGYRRVGRHRLGEA